MAKRNRTNPTPEEFAAILNDFAERGCPNRCKCILCREFELGRQSGFEDAIKLMTRAVQEAMGGRDG